MARVLEHRMDPLLRRLDAPVEKLWQQSGPGDPLWDAFVEDWENAVQLLLVCHRHAPGPCILHDGDAAGEWRKTWGRFVDVEPLPVPSLIGGDGGEVKVVLLLPSSQLDPRSANGGTTLTAQLKAGLDMHNEEVHP